MKLDKLGQWTVGDKVIVHSGFIGRNDAIVTIDKITDGLKGTIFVNGNRYAESGHQRGDGWYRNTIKPATVEGIDKVWRKRERNFLEQLHWNTVSDKSIKEIYQTVKKDIKA